MDNQQDQPGATNPANAGRNAQNPTPAANSSTSASTARKSAATSGAQSTPDVSAAASQNTANAGTQRRGEGEQTSGQEGTFLDTALNSGKKWIEGSGVLSSVNQLPQGLKDLGNRALARVNDLSTTQKVVGGTILAVGLGWLATRKGGKSSSKNSPYNYGRQRDAGSYGRRNYGYQAPDASTSRRSAVGTTGRTDSDSAYANGGSRFGSDASKNNTGINSGSGRATEGFGVSGATDHGAQSGSSRAVNSDFGSSSNE